MKGGIRLRDGHIHTPFCPHGSNDSLEQYIERAIELGYTDISFTEHAPLPSTFVDPTPEQDSAMAMNQLETYFSALERVKKQYQSDITIRIGLEVDFIIGYEEATAHFLEQIGPRLDDSILSVHFLPANGQYFCLDYSPKMFRAMVESFGSTIRAYEAYYEAVLQAVQADLGKYKPKRIGHLTLVHKFQKQFPCPISMEERIIHLLDEIKERQYELDYNGAGVQKPLCQEPYPPDWVVYEAMKRKIPIVYGSDAHCVRDLHQGREQMIRSFL